MHHKVDYINIKILFMLNVRDKMIILHQLIDDTAKTAFEAFVWRWILIFGAAIFTVLDRGSKFLSTIMHNILK